MSREQSEGFGIMHTDQNRKIIRFVEKPKDPAVLDGLRIPPALLKELGQPKDADLYQASMGIYVFSRDALIAALENTCDKSIDPPLPDFWIAVCSADLNLAGSTPRLASSASISGSVPG